MNLILNEAMHIHRCEPAWRWLVDSHKDHDLWCVLSGRGEIRIDGSAYPIRPGCCWLLEPGQQCSAEHDRNNRLRVFAVHFDPVDARGQRRALRPAERPRPGVCVEELGLLEALVQRCIAAQREDTPEGIRLAAHIVQLIHMLLIQIPVETSAPNLDPRISKVYDAILEDPGQHWTVQTMSAAAGLSASQFSRLFRHCMGRSPARCVMEARITRAGVLLRESTTTISEIAEALGYRDVFYFSRQFKTLTGQTPSAYRKT